MRHPWFIPTFPCDEEPCVGFDSSVAVSHPKSRRQFRMLKSKSEGRKQSCYVEGEEGTGSVLGFYCIIVEGKAKKIFPSGVGRAFGRNQKQDIIRPAGKEKVFAVGFSARNKKRRFLIFVLDFNDFSVQAVKTVLIKGFAAQTLISFHSLSGPIRYFHYLQRSEDSVNFSVSSARVVFTIVPGISVQILTDNSQEGMDIAAGDWRTALLACGYSLSFFRGSLVRGGSLKSQMSADESSSSSSWSREQEKAFENALATHPENCSDWWEKIAAAVPGRSLDEIKHHYELLVEDVNNIDAGLVPLPSYASSPEGSADHSTEGGPGKKGAHGGYSQNDAGHGSKSSRSDQERRKGIAWTEDEHRYLILFFLSLSFSQQNVLGSGLITVVLRYCFID
ncbi:hypothetical protein ACLOJK_014316 [Asimina triloba]